MVDFVAWIGSNLARATIGIIFLIGLMFLFKRKTNMKTGKTERKAAKFAGILLIAIGVLGIVFSMLLTVFVVISGTASMLAIGFFALLIIFSVIFLYGGRQILAEANKQGK